MSFHCPIPNIAHGPPGSQKSSDSRGESGIFDGANNFVVKQPVFLENRGQIVQNFAEGKAGEWFWHNYHSS